MTMGATPAEAITVFLEQAGYRRLPNPLKIAGLKFSVTAALVGTGTLPDLIIIADTVSDSDDRILGQLGAIARALDTVKSRRPLTAVLAGPRPTTSVMDAISKICRVLPVSSTKPEEADAAIRNWLAVLLPLNLPQAIDNIGEPMAELEHAVGDEDPFAINVMAASIRGKEAVESLLHQEIAASIEVVQQAAKL